MNALVPFGRFDSIHVARFVDRSTIRRSTTATCLSGPAGNATAFYLIFLGDCDGPGDELLARDRRARPATACARSSPIATTSTRDADLLAWMRAHRTPPAAVYVNWVGRTVRQVREEAALHEALRELARAGTSERDDGGRCCARSAAPLSPRRTATDRRAAAHAFGLAARVILALAVGAAAAGRCSLLVPASSSRRSS